MSSAEIRVPKLPTVNTKAIKKREICIVCKNQKANLSPKRRCLECQTKIDKFYRR